MTQDQFALPHQLTLTQRESLTMTGVTEVVSFDDTSVVLNTQLGTLIVHGRDLHLKNLSPEGGQVSVEGTVSALIYEETKSRQSFWQRLRS